jgi:probable HAF family extracellular repeat protein
VLSFLREMLSPAMPTSRRRRVPSKPCVECLENRSLLTSLIDLGTLPGGSASGADGINDSGEVVGWSYTASGDTHAFLYTQATRMTDLGTLGGNDSEADGINDSGEVVGWSNTASSDTDAFLYTQATGMTDLGVLPGYTDSYATAVNDSGEVVGYSTSASGIKHAFLYAQATGMIDLGTLGGDNSEAYGINNSGQVVGWSNPANAPIHAFLYSQATGMIDIDVQAGESSDQSEAYGINDSGQVVGWNIDGSYDNEDEGTAFSYTSSSGMTSLGSIEGFENSQAFDVNDSGQVVGSVFSYFTNESSGFLDSQATGMVSLDGLGGANAINDSGQIVGWGDGTVGTFSSTAQAVLLEQPGIIAPTSLAWDSTDGGVDFSYQISGGSLSQSTTVGLYWASGTTFDTAIGGPIFSTPTQTAVGTYGPFTVPPKAMGDAPPGATYILAVADPTDLIGSFSTANNVAALSLPVLQISHLNWNMDNTVTTSSQGDKGTNFGHRGVDFDYTITNADNTSLPIPTTIAFYWSSTTDLSGQSELVSDQVNPVGPSLGQDNNQTLSDGYMHLNDPARWGTPPSWAKDVVAVIDPGDTIVKQTPTSSNGLVLSAYLPLASASEVLTGSVQMPMTYGATITATFIPGGGTSIPGGATIPMSEAEVALGVDHFNWLQQLVSIPNYWQPVTLVNLNYSAQLGFDSQGNIIYQSTGEKVETLTRELNLTDPIVNPSQDTPVDYYTRAFVITNPSTQVKTVDVWYDGGFSLPGGQTYSAPIPDSYFYLYNESSNYNDQFSISNQISSDALLFSDTPEQDAAAVPFPTSRQDGGFIAFDTSLVGVNYDLSTYKIWQNSGYDTNFKWMSDALTDETTGGAFLPGGGGTGSDEPPAASGGVFGVQRADQSPPVGLNIGSIADQTVLEGGRVSLSATASDPVEGLTLTYTLGAGAPAGATIDPNAGVFTWAVPTSEPSGEYPVTVRVTDNGDPSLSASATFTIVVLAPPRVENIQVIDAKKKGTVMIDVFFNEQMNPSEAGALSDYFIVVPQKNHGKKAHTPKSTPVAFTARYIPANDSVVLTLRKPTKKLLQVTVRNTVSAANGLTLGSNYTVDVQ